MGGWLTSCTAFLLLGGVSEFLRTGGDDVRSDADRGCRAKLISIAPGTEIANQPPKGWSHLVIKSIPRLASGDLETLPRFRLSGRPRSSAR